MLEFSFHPETVCFWMVLLAVSDQPSDNPLFSMSFADSVNQKK
jgi:hypothetical protein